MATHVLQFVFNGMDGFHFPFAYFPTSQINAQSLFLLYWDSVYALEEAGFHTHLCICDGAQANRTFIRNHFPNDEAAVDAKFTAPNLVTGEPHTFMMDPSVRT